MLVWVVNIGHFSDDTHGGVLRGAIFYFKIAVALAVAAIPEGLPTVITTCLALGSLRMAQKNAIVRSLPSVETLGCTSVICSDKTGTLTTNRMCVRKVLFVDKLGADANARPTFREFDVSGNTFEPTGVFTSGAQMEHGVHRMRVMRELATVCSLCNDSNIVYNPTTHAYDKVGEATEAALKVLVEKIGCDDVDPKMLSPEARAHAVNDAIAARWEKRVTLEFSRDRKSMSVYCVPRQTDDGPKLQRTSSRTDRASAGKLFVKGAPESVLERCTHVRLNATADTMPMTPKLRSLIDQSLREYGAGRDALRCLALAVVDEPQDLSKMTLSDAGSFVQFEQNMTFIGIVAMLDPPRPEVRSSIEKCRQAGIRVIVITGDNRNTAEAICRHIGVFTEDEDVKGKSFTGVEFDDMSHERRLEVVQHASLFSRTEPSHKSQLVDLLHELGHVTAMTGDGVNDAPALKKAEIGVAMGSGTSVAKFASHIRSTDACRSAALRVRVACLLSSAPHPRTARATDVTHDALPT